MPFIACGRCLPCAAGRFFECQDKRVSGVDTQGGFAEYVVTGSRETLRLSGEQEYVVPPLSLPPSDGIGRAIRIPGHKSR